MTKKNLIVFDIDGTLTESVQVHQKAFIEALQDIGVQSIDTNFKEFKHHTDSYIAKVIYEKDTKQAFTASKLEDFENRLTERIIASVIDEVAGAKKIIDFLEFQSDFAICYATGSLRRAAEFKLTSIGIPFNEKQLVASDEIHERERIVQKAIARAHELYNVETFERIISVGDGLWDLITANNLGIEFIGIGIKNRELLKENGAQVLYTDLTEFQLT